MVRCRVWVAGTGRRYGVMVLRGWVEGGIYGEEMIGVSFGSLWGAMFRLGGVFFLVAALGSDRGEIRRSWVRGG